MLKVFPILAIIMVVGLAGCGIRPGISISPSEGLAKYGQLPSDYQATVIAQIQAELIDPMSAQFQFQGQPEPKENGWHGFVWVNAKNRFGGYVGRQRYEYLFQNSRLFMLIRPNGMRVLIQH